MTAKKKKAKRKKQPSLKSTSKKSTNSGVVKIPLLNSRFHETDYIGASLQDIYDDLKGHRNATHTVVEELKTYKTEVTQNKDKLDHYESIILYVDNFIKTYSRFLSEFNRLLLEIPEGLNENHIYLLKKLFDANDASDARFRLIDSCKNFKSDYISVDLPDESIRPLFDNIYANSIGVVYAYGGFSAAIPHLKTYIGAKLKNNESALSSKKESAEAKAERKNIIEKDLVKKAGRKKIKTEYQENQLAQKITRYKPKSLKAIQEINEYIKNEKDRIKTKDEELFEQQIDELMQAVPSVRKVFKLDYEKSRIYYKKIIKAFINNKKNPSQVNESVICFRLKCSTSEFRTLPNKFKSKE